MSPEYYISSLTGVEPTSDDVSVFQGNVNLNGNTGNDKDKTDTAAHGWYFGQVAACAPTGFELKKERRDVLIALE